MKKIKPLHFTLALFLALILSFSFSCTSNENTLAGLSLDSLNVADAEMRALVDEGKLSCVSTMIVKDGKVVHRLTSGLSSIEDNKALEEDASCHYI